MPTVTPEQARSKAFIDAVTRITGTRGLNPKKIMRVVKWQKGVEDAMEEINEAHKKMLKNYALLDDKGNFISQEGRPGTWQIDPEAEKDPARAQEFYDAQMEFSKMGVEIKIMPLNLSEFPKADLSPAEVTALGELLQVID